ncbi:Uncharacterised protein [BD1-7 clade bacterium]|uniref:Chitin-binding type-3 domain-containing protein n=1 Tax=BD1-7 clade bacterium TaxID=2029982 RepID=A0A5S9PK31_9GAMM|nr:Uncharacterised protein [BD1-7 clade bacterium]
MKRTNLIPLFFTVPGLSMVAFAQDDREYIVSNMTSCYAFGTNGWSEDTKDIRLVEGVDVDIRAIAVNNLISRTTTTILNGDTQVVPDAYFYDHPGAPDLGATPQTVVNTCINPAGYYDDYDWDGFDFRGWEISNVHCPGYVNTSHTTTYFYETSIQTNEGPVYAIQTESRANILPDPRGDEWSWKFTTPSLVLTTADSSLGRACKKLIDAGGTPAANPTPIPDPIHPSIDGRPSTYPPQPDVKPQPKPKPTPRPGPTPEPTPGNGKDKPADSNPQAWGAGSTYNGGDVVIYNGKTWTAQWWTRGEEPGSTGKWGVWR